MFVGVFFFFFIILVHGYFSQNIIDTYMVRPVGNDVVMANCLEPVVINSLSVAKLTLSPPVGLEPTTHKSHSLADQYLCWNFGTSYGE